MGEKWNSEQLWGPQITPLSHSPWKILAAKKATQNNLNICVCPAWEINHSPQSFKAQSNAHYLLEVLAVFSSLTLPRPLT